MHTTILQERKYLALFLFLTLFLLGGASLRIVEEGLPKSQITGAHMLRQVLPLADTQMSVWFFAALIFLGALLLVNAAVHKPLLSSSKQVVFLPGKKNSPLRIIRQLPSLQKKKLRKERKKMSFSKELRAEELVKSRELSSLEHELAQIEQKLEKLHS